MSRSPLRLLFSNFFILFVRGVVFVLKVFIALGEGTSRIVRSGYIFFRAHVLAVFFVLKFVFQFLIRGILSIKHRVVRLFTNFASLFAHSLRDSVAKGRHILRIPSDLLKSVVRNSIQTVSNVGKIPSLLIHKIQDTLRVRKRSPATPKQHITVPNHTSLEVPLQHTKKIKTKYIQLTIFAISILIIIFGSLSYLAYDFYIHLPRPQDIGKVNFALTSHVYDRNGKLLFDFFKDQRRTPVVLSDLPPYVAKATIAIEDKDFYNHRGVSLISGVARALRETYLRNKGLQGGSTITQQLVKTALLTPERTVLRKFKEVIIALETERVYSKNQILEMYLNQVPYGGSVYGIEEASRKFFGKSAKDLTLSESALLAGLPQAPTIYSPFTSIENATARRNQVLQEMLVQELINLDEYESARKEPVRIIPDTNPIEAPHFVFYVRKYLENYLDTNDLYQGGYMIRTTLDLEIQKKAEEILEEEITKINNLNVSNGAILVTNPQTGEILAMVGSVDFFDGISGEFNVTTALRQPGSSIKPIMYAYALQHGYTAASIIEDTPVVFQTGGYEAYRPVNYDGRFHGRVTVRNALANSYNIPAVKVMNRIGVWQFMEFANEVGIETWEDPSNYGLALALGGGEVTMTNMAQAYGVLANEGKKVELSPIVSLAGNGGVVLGLDTDDSDQIIDPAYAYIISDILSDNQTRASAFGYNSQLEIKGYKVAVKTGTTDEKRDNWTIGYTPNYLVVVWVGNNDHSPMNPYLTSGVTGAAPIWNRMMQYLLDEKGLKQNVWYEQPTNIVQKPCMGKNEVFVVGTENSVPCALPTPRKDVAATSNTAN